MKQDKEENIKDIIDYFVTCDKRSHRPPYSLLAEYSFCCEEFPDYWLFYIRMNTIMYNFLPDFFFKWVIEKGLKRAGFDVKLNFISAKEVVLLENFKT